MSLNGFSKSKFDIRGYPYPVYQEGNYERGSVMFSYKGQILEISTDEIVSRPISQLRSSIKCWLDIVNRGTIGSGRYPRVRK